MTKTLLVDVDSPIPNLALMHISAWRKSLGDEVGFSISDPDRIYASCIFDWNRHKTDGLRIFYPDAEIDIGGSGINFGQSERIPEEVWTMMPDYSLYPECDYDLGFTTRGCTRNCHFCIVPKKEGKFHRNQHPSEFHHPSHKKAVYMDNNILADREWFFEVADWLKANHIAVDFNQGLDIRLIDQEIAETLADLKPVNQWRIAFDSMAYREPLERGLAILDRAGIKLRHDLMAYVYVHDGTQVDDAAERCSILRKWGVMPYPMFNRHAKRTQAMTDLKRWARPWIFYTVGWDEYRRDRT